MRFEQHEEILKQYAVRLATLLADDVKVSPLILDGPNHEGKARFIQKFIHFLKENQAPYQYILIDAAQSGQSQLAMMSFMADLANALPEENQECFYRAAEHLLHLASEQNMLLEGYLKKKNLAALTQAISGSCGGNMLQQYLHAQENIRTIQNLLEQHTEKRPLLVFINGLDTCPDDFTVKLLHAIDMVFKAKNMQFVLLAQRERLLASIAQFCGSASAPETYLEEITGLCFKIGRATEKV